MTDKDTRLIEVAFPLEQVSLDSVHEKNVRHGHISTLHIWPARRPLAACRAALVATLLPDPGDAEERKEIYRRLAGENARSSNRCPITSPRVPASVRRARKRSTWNRNDHDRTGPLRALFGRRDALPCRWQ